MKVVHVETGRHFYGGAQQVVWLISGLAARGVDNVLVCLPDSDVRTVAIERGIRIETIPCAGDHDLRFAWRLRQFLGREKPDVLHSHSRRGADFLGGQAAQMAGIPAVVSRRVDNPESRMMAGLRYRAFAKVIAISDNIACLLVDNGLDRDRLAVIRDAVDVDSINAFPDCAECRRTFDIAADDFAIAVVAQLIERKGHRFLFDALPEVLASHPNTRVVCFGTGEEAAPLQAHVLRLGLQSRVTLAGFHKYLDNFLACFDLLVHPAVREGLGVAMLKGAAAGLPVVAFDTAGAKEAVAPDKTGLLVPARNTGQLATAIQSLIASPDRRRAMGEAGRARMRAEFSVDSMAEDHLRLYESVLKR